MRKLLLITNNVRRVVYRRLAIVDDLKQRIK